MRKGWSAIVSWNGYVHRNNLINLPATLQTVTSFTKTLTTKLPWCNRAIIYSNFLFFIASKPQKSFYKYIWKFVVTFETRGYFVSTLEKIDPEFNPVSCNGSAVSCNSALKLTHCCNLQSTPHIIPMWRLLTSWKRFIQRLDRSQRAYLRLKGFISTVQLAHLPWNDTYI